MRARKIIKRLLILFVILVWAIGTRSVGGFAEGQEYQEELNSNINEQLEKLDLEELEAYVKTLPDGTKISVIERLMDYLDGDGFGYADFFSEMTEILFSSIKDLLPCFACIGAIALLCGLLNTLQSRFLGQSTAQIVFFAAYLGALIPIFAVLTECIFSARTTVLSLKKQMEIIFPIMLTLMSASGGTVTAAIYKPAVAFLCNGLVSIISDIVYPFTIAMIIFSMAGKLFDGFKTDKFAAFFKSINKWIMGIGVTVFGFFLSVQGITAATYDGITRRAAKYAIGTGVPIVGGFLSGGFDLAIAGSVLIKNALGNFSLFLIVSVLFQPLLLLIATNLLLRLTAAVTQPFGDSKISSFMEETAGHLNYFTAGLLFTAFLYFIVILLLVCSSEVLF